MDSLQGRAGGASQDLLSKMAKAAGKLARALNSGEARAESSGGSAKAVPQELPALITLQVGRVCWPDG
jgi:hypothetical protein